MAEEYIFTLKITGPDNFTQTYQVSIGISTIGRQSGTELHLNHSQVSRGHARLECTSTECRISDLGSSNGTLVNGEKLTPDVPVLLLNGDSIKIGPFMASFESKAVEPEEAKPTPPPAEDKPAATIASEPEKKAAPPKAVKKAKPKTEPKPTPPKKKAAPKTTPKKTAAPAKKPPPPSFPPTEIAAAQNGNGYVPPGLSIRSQRLLPYLPGIYHTDFMARFLGIFESIFVPIEWTIDNFDLFLDPGTAPRDFLPWLANWFDILFDSTWSENQRRTLLKEARQIYARRGTKWALARVLEIYTGETAKIDDLAKGIDPHTFTVDIPLAKKAANQELIEAIIDVSKPAHTSYTLKFKGRG